MSLISAANAFVARNSRSGPYDIKQSLRFDGSSTYLSRTPGSDTSTNKKGTFSAWMKVSANSGTNGGQFIGAADSYAYGQFYNQEFYFGNTSSSISTAAKIRDYSAWYHVVFVFDTTLATANDRMIIYVNGSRQATGTFNSQPSQNSNFVFINTAQVYNIGRRPSDQYFNGYLAEVNFIDGSALTPGDFGEEDDNGVWRPIKYAGSYTGNSFYLKFASGDGTDSSGLSNTWTANNFTTSGTGTDVMSDTPTTNYCTLNPLFNNGTEGPGTLSEGNLRHTSDDNYAMCPGTMSLRNGKYYWEAQPITIGTSIVGIIRGTNPAENNYIGYDPNGNVFGFGYQNNGYVYGAAGTGTASGVVLSTSQNTYTTTDVIGIAVDIPNGTLDWYKNGTLEYSVTGINDDDWFPAVSSYTSDTWEVNFGQRAFAYTPPTGFKALNTRNLSAPDIADGSQYFNTVLYTGNGSTQSITGVGFQPDFVWIKSRSAANWHGWYDAVRGASTKLSSNYTGSEFTVSGVSSFNTDGFSVGSDGGENQSGATFAAWNWLAANGTSSNTDGSITSTVSANPTAGFSVVTYTGSGSAATVGHGLAVAPQMLIVKRRNAATNWYVYHTALGNTKALPFTSAAAATANFWNNTDPTSTVFSVGNLGDTNAGTMLAYCFAEVEGYSKFGSYAGNGSTDGPFVFCGFKPAILIVKATISGSSWGMWDSARDPYNSAESKKLYPNISAQEATSYVFAVDFLSNGFKPRSVSGDINESGRTFIFAAFASSPFGGDGVSPATAR